MTWYPAKVQIAYGSSPKSDPGTVTWTDVTTQVPGWSSSQGRSTEFDDFEAGVCSFDMYNDSGSSTPGRDLSGELVPWDYSEGKGPRKVTTAAGTDNYLTYWVESFSPTILGYSVPWAYFRMPGSTANGEVYLSKFYSAPVTAGTQYTANIKVYTDIAAHNGYCFISWLDENLTELSRSTGVAAAITTSTSGANHSVTATAPAGAYYAAVGFRKTTTDVSAQYLYVGYPSVRAGSSFTGEWAEPVTPVVGNLVRISVQDSGATYRDVFTGAIETVEVNNEDGSQEISTVSITAVDAQKYLANIGLEQTLYLANKAYMVKLLVPLQDSGSSVVSTATSYPVTLVYNSTTGLYDADASGQISLRWKSGQSTYEYGVEGPTGSNDLALRLTSKHSDTTGASGFYLRADAGMVNSGSGQYTIEGWFKVPAMQSVDQALLTFSPGLAGGSGVGPIISIGKTGGINPGKIQLDNFDSGTAALLWGSSITVTDNRWHHLALTLTLSTSTKAFAVIYLDGQKIIDTNAGSTGVTPSSGTTWVTTGDLGNCFIGWNGRQPGASTPATFLSGDLSFWAFHAGVLTDTQIANIYNSGAVGAAFPGATEIVAAGSLLDAMGWPNTGTSRSLYSTGVFALGGVEGGDGSVLDGLKKVADSANAALYIDGSGRVAMSSYDTRYYPTTTLTPSESTGTTPEDDLEWSLDDSLLFTAVTVSGVNDGAVDVLSSSSYGVRQFSVDTALGDSTAMSSLGNWLLYLRGKQRVRVGQISFLLSAAPSTLWDTLLTWGLATGKVLDLSAMLRSQEPNLITRYFIESFTWEYDQDSLTFRVTCDLSPAKYYEDGLLRLNSSTQGQVGLYRLGL